MSERRWNWKNTDAWIRWVRWWIAGQIVTMGAGVFAGAALLGIRAAGWFALGSWVFSVLVRLVAVSAEIEGRRECCASCGVDCGRCLARALAASAPEVK